MKKYTILGLLILSLTIQSCKNDKSKTQDNQVTTEIEIEKEVDSVTKEAKITIGKEISDSIPSKEDEVMTEENVALKSNIPKDIIKEVVETVQQTETKVTEEIKVKEETKEVVEEIVIETPVEVVETIEEIEVVTEPEVEEVVEEATPIEPEPVVEKPKEITAPKDWIVPSKYKTMKNPTDPKVDIAIGKSVYDKHCKSCHGKKGLGDGTKADEVEGDLGDFSSKEFQAQTDGELFYKSYFGRDDMPNYEKKIPDEEDIWLVVNYMRTMGK